MKRVAPIASTIESPSLISTVTTTSSGAAARASSSQCLASRRIASSDLAAPGKSRDGRSIRVSSRTSTPQRRARPYAPAIASAVWWSLR